MFYDINRKGDKAVISFSRKYDYSEQDKLVLDQDTINKAADQISEQLKRAIDLARKKHRSFSPTAKGKDREG